MTARSHALAAALLALASATPASASPGSERYVVIAHDAVIGSLDARIDGARVDLEYHTSNNGRGPRQQEHIELDGDGRPKAWTINGTSLVGAPVHEELRTDGAGLRWISQADRGSAEAKAKPLYIGNDASPWALGIYVRYLARVPGNAVDALPGGRLTATRLQRQTFAGKAGMVTADLYRLTGLDLEPKYVLLDGGGSLFAVLDEELLVRAGYEAAAPELRRLLSEQTERQLADLQQRLGHRHDKPVRITNVRIFDPRAKALSPLRSVVMYRDRITLVDDRPVEHRPDELVMDGGGGTLIPGLIDMHSHTSEWSGLYYLAAGVTMTRDMGNDNGFLDALLTRIDAGIVPGPRVIRSGLVEGLSPYSAHDGFVVDNLPDAVDRVRWYADRGYWQLKIYNSIHADWVKPLAGEAHRLGMRVVGHTVAFASPTDMILAGYDELTHVNQLALGWLYRPDEDNRTSIRITGLYRIADLDLDSTPVRQTIDLMKQRHVSLDTTMVIQERLAISRAGQVNEGDRAYLDHFPIAYQRFRRRTMVPIASDEQDRKFIAARDRMIDLMTLLNREGIVMWPGTDDGTGVTLHRELELYTRAGMSPAAVLARDTLEAATYLGQGESLGSIERGKLADFALLPGDPTTDIGAVRTPAMVVRGGVIYYPEEIYGALGIRPFAAKPPAPASR